MCDVLNSGDVEKTFDGVVNKYLDKYGVKAGMEGNK